MTEEEVSTASLKARLLSAGMLTTKQLGDKLGVERSTIGRWRTQGLIEARICSNAGESGSTGFQSRSHRIERRDGVGRARGPGVASTIFG